MSGATKEAPEPIETDRKPIEQNGRGVYHANGHLPGGGLVLWAQTDAGEIIGMRFCEPENYSEVAAELEQSLCYHETPEALHRALEEGREAKDRLRKLEEEGVI